MQYGADVEYALTVTWCKGAPTVQVMMELFPTEVDAVPPVTFQ